MATEAFTNPSTPAPARTAAAPFFPTLKRWYIARQTRRALNQLSARELADFGIAPHEIDAVAERVARQ